MASTLREELASLKIDRPDPMKSRRNGHRKSHARGGGGTPAVVMDSLADPAGYFGGGGLFGYRQYDQIRSRPEVTSAWSSG